MKAPKTWRCQRVQGGIKCGGQNPARNRKCKTCGKLRPVRKRPAHTTALDLTYEQYVELNGGVETCGICGSASKSGRRLHRDHDHRRAIPRGLLCFRCNAALRGYMTLEWLRAAVRYVERTERGGVHILASAEKP